MKRRGFFETRHVDKRRRLPNRPQCGLCGLHKHCQSPKMKYTGQGRRKILVIGEAPGAEEDRDNEQFVGKAGKKLKGEAKRCGIDLNRDCWKTNALRCRPPKNKINSKMIAACRPAVFEEIRKLNPISIILIGSSAVESVATHLFADSGKFSLVKWLGWLIPNQEPNCWISSHYHTSYLLRESSMPLNKSFSKGLKKALTKQKRPWKEVPDFEGRIETIYKPRQVAKFLQQIQSGSIAFDYETTCLKPEYEGAEIVTCSVCWNGKRTIAFPWTLDVWDERIEEMSRLLRSPVKKIAASMKFEERWTRFFLKTRVKNWDWDTMLAAHVLNNARGLTGLKFQTFVRFGLPPYDSHIKPFLKPMSKKHHLNRIHEIPLKDLLVYNGMDSLLEYKLAQKQKREIKDGIQS